MSITRLVFILLLPLAAQTPAFAERVLVTAESGEVGHAWLFGSGRGICWLALPRHVAENPFTKTLAPFRFVDQTGIGGESGMPIGVADVEGAEAAAGIGDLAFARVAAGPRNAACLSRLGLPTFAYAALLKRAPKLVLLSLLPTSFGILEVSILRARTDAAGGGLLDLGASDTAAADLYFKKGLSGAVAEVVRDAESYPFAMVFEMDREQMRARALRFDLVRAAFDLVEAEEARRPRPAGTAAEGVPFQVLGYDALVLSTGPGAGRLSQGDACWRVAARGGQRMLSLTIGIVDKKVRLSALSVVQAPACGNAGLAFTVDQRVGDADGWSRAASCRTVASASQASCPIDLSAPRQLRIQFEARSTIGISGLFLD